MAYGQRVNIPNQLMGLVLTRPATCSANFDSYVPVSLFRDKNLDFYARDNVNSFRTAADPHRDNRPQRAYKDLAGSSVEPRWSGGLNQRLEFRGTNQFGMMRDIQSKNATVAPTAPQLPGVPLKDPIENRDLFWSNFNTTASSGVRPLDASGRPIAMERARRGIRTLPNSVFN